MKRNYTVEDIYRIHAEQAQAYRFFEEVWNYFISSYERDPVLNPKGLSYHLYQGYDIVASKVRVRGKSSFSSDEASIMIPVISFEEDSWKQYIDDYIDERKALLLQEQENRDRKVYRELNKRFNEKTERNRYYELKKKFEPKKEERE